jgi:hypothetical protein
MTASGLRQQKRAVAVAAAAMHQMMAIVQTYAILPPRKLALMPSKKCVLLAVPCVVPAR